MPKANSVYPTQSHLAKSSTSTSPSPAVPNLYPAMEGLYVYTAKRLEAIRLGSEASKGGYKPVDPAEFRSVALWRAVGAEFMAQVIFVFVGGCSVVFKADSLDDNAHTVQIALAFGLCIMALIQMIGHVSGGHINPAVTVAMAVSMNITVVRAVLYVTVQCMGAIVGGFILRGVVPKNEINESMTTTNLAVTSLAEKMTAGQGLGIEIILTFVLVFVIFGTTDENRPSFGSPALLIGLTVTLLHLAGIRATGASMNPSRSLGSAIASTSTKEFNRFANHWVYWLGPMIGGILAALTYKLLISPYRNCLSMDDAIQKLLQDENLVAIPRDYFKVSTGKNAKDIKESSNL